MAYSGTDEVGNVQEDRTITFEVIPPTAFDLTLNVGMNLISLPGDLANTDIKAVFGDVREVDLIFTRDGGRWILAFRDDPDADFSGDLTTIDARHAYWVRSNGAPDLISILIPPLGAQQILPSIPVTGGQWNLVPVISLLPPADTTQGTELDPNDYLGVGNWTRAFTFDSGAWQRILLLANPQCDTDPADIAPADCGGLNTVPTPDSLNDAVQIGRGYWVWFTADDRIVP